ncbi:MAG: class I SAM-dependent methyltransferase [Nitrososphaerales archaeon]
MNRYILGSAKKELKRLKIQSTIFERETLETLKLAGIKPGMHCVDIGCGIGDVSFIMAKLVGKTGSVIGIDTNKDVIEFCKKRARKENVKNIKFFAGSIYENRLKKNSFDFLFSRFLFQHLAEPKAALREMIKLVRRGGTIAAEENDHGMWLSYPPSSGFEKLRSAYIGVLRLAKGDELVARKLYGLFLGAGLNANVGVYSICIPMGKPSSILGILVAEVLKSKILETKLMGPKEFGKMLSELKEYARRKEGLALYALTFRVWGKK